MVVIGDFDDETEIGGDEMVASFLGAVDAREVLRGG